MRKILNQPDKAVPEMLSGMAKAHAGIIEV